MLYETICWDSEKNSNKQNNAEELAATVRYTKESSTHTDLHIFPRGIHESLVTPQEETWDAKKSGCEASEYHCNTLLLFIFHNFT